MNQNNHSLLEKLRYKFENTLSAGASAMIAWLAIATLFIIIVAAIVLSLTQLVPEWSFAENLWQSFMRTVDPGTMAGDEGWWFRILSLLVTIGGIFILAILIGILTSGIEEKLDELRKGRSKVLEQNHTLILGWSSKIYAIVNELILANENQHKPKVVILADADKVEMEDDLKNKIADFKNTQVIVRSGSPLEATDIAVVSPNAARSIIVLSPDEDNNPDTKVIKTVLALTNSKNRKNTPYHIVAEIKDKDNMEAAHLVGGKEAVYVLSADLISRVTAQTCRQSGLSLVYTEMLGFDGSEIYFTAEKSLVGKSFKHACYAYETTSVIGVLTDKNDILINPNANYIIEPTDQLIAISEDDDTLILSGKTNITINEKAINITQDEALTQEKTLILGWNEKGYQILEELDNYVGQNSETLIIAELDITQQINQLNAVTTNQNIRFIKGNTTSRATLQQAKPASFKNIVVLSYIDERDVQESDANTLITLLHLRNFSEEAGKPFSIVSEMLDIRNRELAEVAKADDYIVSDNLISLMLTQMSEDKNLKQVYDVLFEADGSEIYLKPAEKYLTLKTEVDFYTVLEAAFKRQEVAIGYRKNKDAWNPENNYGVMFNPDKSQTVTFEPGDTIIVLAED